MACKISDGELIDLLRGLRSGAIINRFVHRVDVCSAAPEDLVADLQPAPGTDLTQDGYNSVWYFYCEKRYKNTQGKASGHRQRAIAGGDTCWHAETRPKDVEGSQGGTFCNLSYGCKKQGSGRSFDRLGWYMTEYDDMQQMQHGGAGHKYVLCKIYRSSSSLAKGKSSKSSASSSNSSKNASSKRKALGDHAEARPSKMIHEQMQHQDTIFSDNYLMPCYQGINPMIADVGCGVQQQYVEEQQQLMQQQLISAEEMQQASEFVETEYGMLSSAVEEMQHQDTIFSQDTILSDNYPMPCYQGMNPMIAHVGCGVQQQYVEEEQQLMQQLPISAEEMQQDSEFVETEYGLLPSAVAEINVEDWINCPEMFEGQEDQDLQQQQQQQQNGGVVETPVVVVTQEATVGKGETTASGEELAFLVQEEQTTQMEQQPGAEKDPITDVIRYLQTKPWLWPDSPSTMSCQASAAAMLYQQQEGSHYWTMQPQQLPSFPMG